VILLTTTGRKSQRPRTVALHALVHGDHYVVAASNAGEPRHPEWYLNLRADRLATVQHGPVRIPVRARTAEGEERSLLWNQITARDRSYAEYQARTDREIPVVVLEPSAEK
jgi:deazaflavin-dependent oxidoreductase (nitroreductase family)